MTPKEEANDLINQHYDLTYDSDNNDYDERHEIAKKCALISVNTILHVLNQLHWVIVDRDIKYWQEVKQEIENHK